MRSILGELLEMLTYCRPHSTPTEDQFIARYVSSLPGAERDPFGNWHVKIGGDCPILWSSHTDTVHWHDGRQTIAYDCGTGVVSLSKRSKKKSRCLGADCTAGVWVMRQMILAGIPGSYVFHAQEEVGANGSNWLARNRSEWLQGFKFAIAFDRRGTTSIVTEQRHGETASDLFALSFAEAIGKVSDLKMSADPTGIFTDTAEYSHLISECTNISVGYAHEHSRNETLNTIHLLALADAMCAINLAELIADRTPVDQYENCSSDWDWPAWLQRSPDRPRTEINPRGWTSASTVIDRVDDPTYEIADSDDPDYCPYHEECEDCDCMSFDHGPYLVPIDQSGSLYLDQVYEDVQNALRRKP